MVSVSFVLIALILVNLVLLGTVIYLAYFSKKKVEVRRDSRSDEILAAAEQEAEEIVKASVEKAQETLTDASYIKDDLIRSIESSMRSIAESAVVSFQDETKQTHEKFGELYRQIASEYARETQKSVAQLDQEAEGVAEKFRKDLQHEVIASQKKADARAEEAFQVVKNELETYKQQKMKSLDAQIQEMVGRVFQEVLGKSLTGADHTQLVLQALEDAKSEGVLSFLGQKETDSSSSDTEVVAAKEGKQLGATEYKSTSNKKSS